MDGQHSAQYNTWCICTLYTCDAYYMYTAHSAEYTYAVHAMRYTHCTVLNLHYAILTVSEPELSVYMQADQRMALTHHLLQHMHM